MADTSPKYWWGGGGGAGGGGGGRREIFNMYAFGVRLRYANLSNIMLGICDNSFICLYTGVVSLFHLLLNNAKL